MITQDGLGWEIRSAEETELVDRFYQVFGADIMTDPLHYSLLNWVVGHYVKTAKTQARALRKSGNDEVSNYLLQSANLLTQRYNIPFLL